MKKFSVFLIIILGFLLAIAGSLLTYYDFFALGYLEKSLALSSFAGVLGSTVYMSRGFYQSVVSTGQPNKEFNFDKWIWWYLLRPILGGISGAIMFLILTIALDLDQTAKNQVIVYILGFLIGYNFHDFIEKKISKKLDVT